jgi:hypothetical protein
MKELLISSQLLMLGSYSNSKIHYEGSLVIATASMEELVVVSDRLVITLKDGEKLSDNEICKIDLLNKHAGFTVTGTRLFVKGSKQFEPAKIVKEFFSKGSFEITKRVLDEIKMILFSEYKKTIQGNFEQLDFYVLVYGYDLKENRFRIGSIRFDAQSPTKIEIYSATTDKEMFEKSIPIGVGRAELVDEALGGNKKEYESLRNDPVVVEISKVKSLLDKSKVISFAKKIISETSKINKFVGSKVDVAIIDKNGIRWVEQDSDSK